MVRVKGLAGAIASWAAKLSDVAGMGVPCLCKEGLRGASLLVQWLGICPPMQGMWVRSLITELRSHMLWVT